MTFSNVIEIETEILRFLKTRSRFSSKLRGGHGDGKKPFKTSRYMHAEAYRSPDAGRRGQRRLLSTFKGPSWKTAFDVNGYPTRAAEVCKARISVEQLKFMEMDGVRYASTTLSETGRVPWINLRLLPGMIRAGFPEHVLEGLHRPVCRPIRWFSPWQTPHRALSIRWPFKRRYYLRTSLHGAADQVEDAGRYIDLL